MSSIMKGLVDEQDIEETKKLSAQEKFKRSMARAGYDMDAGAKRLQDLLDKQKKEREELQKKETKDVSEDATLQFAAEITPTVSPYAGIKDRKFRGAIGEGIKQMFENPNESPTDAGYQEGGWRKMNEEEVDEDLRKWFKEKWVRFGPDGKIRGACARGSSSEGKPKCLPQAKAHALGKKGRKYAAAKKRREDPNPERSGPAKNVATKKKSNEAMNPAQQAAIAINMKKHHNKPKDSLNELFEPQTDYYQLANNKIIQATYRPLPNQNAMPGTVKISYVNPALMPKGSSFDSTGRIQRWDKAPDGVKQEIQKFVNQSGVAEDNLNEGLWDWIKDKLSNKKPIQWSENYYDFIIRNDPLYLQAYLNAVKNDPNYIEWKKNNPNAAQQSTSQANYTGSQNRPEQYQSGDDFTAPHGSSENELKMFVNGTKPAAIVPEPNFSSWAKVINSGKYWTKQLISNGKLHSIIIVQPGNEESGKQIYELVQNAMNLANQGDFRAYENSNYHRRLGKLLGYPKDKIEQFINNYFKDKVDLAKTKIDEQDLNETFDQPYKLKWYPSDMDEVTAYAEIPNGDDLSIMFNLDANEEGEEAWSVEFYRNDSQEVTGEGDAQRIFATVLSAIKTFIKKYKPNRVIFSASKEVEPGQKSQSRANLYDRLVQRYAKALGFKAFRADAGNKVHYELNRINKGVVEGANSITYQQQKGKNKFSVKMLVNGKSAGIFQYDANTGRTITELDSEFRGQGLGQRLILKGIYTAAMLGLDYVEDESRTEMFDRAMDSLADAGYIVNDDERWYVTTSGEQFLKQGVAEGYSDISGLLSASNLNKSFIITAELAEGGKKKFRVKAQNERVAMEKFKKHHSMAKILNVKEEGVEEGSKYPRTPASYHLKKYPVPPDQLARPVKKEPNKPEQKPEQKVDEDKRIPRKLGQPANSKKHSDLYTDENPKGTIHGLKFATADDARASVSKIRNSNRSHAHKIQAAVAMEQRAKAAGKAEAASVYRKFINSMKKKTDESQLDEACWKGYHKEGMKTMFGKKYPNCVKNKKSTNEYKELGKSDNEKRKILLAQIKRFKDNGMLRAAQDAIQTYKLLFPTEKVSERQNCPECGGAMYEVSLMNEKKDACYYKVKSRYKVWPSAYASGALVKCRKKGAKNWGTKTEGQIYSTGGGAGEAQRWYRPKDNLGETSSILEGIQQVDEVNWKKWAATGALAGAAALSAINPAQARVSPQDDGTMSPSFAQQVAQNSMAFKVIKDIGNGFEQVNYKGMNGVRDTENGKIILISKVPGNAQIITIANGKETTDYVDMKSLGNETKQALQSISNPIPSGSIPKPTHGVSVEGDTLTFNGKNYNIVKINSNGPQPRLSQIDYQVNVSPVDFGIRSMGVFPAKLKGNTAYVYVD